MPLIPRSLKKEARQIADTDNSNVAVWHRYVLLAGGAVGRAHTL
jgi:hypothetical protein